MIYDVISWNAVLNDCSLLPRPFAYISPDLQLLEFMKRNKGKVRVKVLDTGDEYSNITCWGIVREAAFEAGCRPNFFMGTQYYAVELEVFWNGYPKKLGKLEFIKGPVS